MPNTQKLAALKISFQKSCSIKAENYLHLNFVQEYIFKRVKGNLHLFLFQIRHNGHLFLI